MADANTSYSSNSLPESSLATFTSPSITRVIGVSLLPRSKPVAAMSMLKQAESPESGAGCCIFRKARTASDYPYKGSRAHIEGITLGPPGFLLHGHPVTH